MGQTGSILSFPPTVTFRRRPNPRGPQSLHRKTRLDPAGSGPHGANTQKHARQGRDSAPDVFPALPAARPRPRPSAPTRPPRGAANRRAPTCLPLRLHADVLAQLLHSPVPDALLVRCQPLSELDLGGLHGGGPRARWSIPGRSPLHLCLAPRRCPGHDCAQGGGGGAARRRRAG